MKRHEHIVSGVLPGSIAEEMGIEPGDKLLSIDGQEITDIFDYQFYVEEEELLLLIEKPDGEQWELEIEKDPDEQLGITFEQGLMDAYRSCRNKCIFCFIDQMPPGMRETLYFKDDDSRLSFLQGNYITLTNMSDRDVERIVRYRLEPINISFQTTNPELRCRMLHNRFAGEALKKVDILYQGGIEMNGQIVLCKGINDGEELERSIRDLGAYLPLLRSVSVVPVGLTKYREGLCPLEPFTKEDAKKVLEVIRRWQEKFYREYGLHFIHAGDEWYLLAEEEVPGEEQYDGYLQLENGVGMWRMFRDEFLAELTFAHRRLPIPRNIDVVTGTLAAPLIEAMMAELHRQYPMIEVTVHPIQNKFFGGNVSVAGLVTATDILAQCKGKLQSNVLGVPEVMLRSERDMFLDSVTVDELAQQLGVKIEILPSGGGDEARALLRSGLHIARRRRE